MWSASQRSLVGASIVLMLALAVIVWFGSCFPSQCTGLQLRQQRRVSLRSSPPCPPYWPL